MGAQAVVRRQGPPVPRSEGTSRINLLVDFKLKKKAFVSFR